jgi:hypothetical protein
MASRRFASGRCSGTGRRREFHQDRIIAESHTRIPNPATRAATISAAERRLCSSWAFNRFRARRYCKMAATRAVKAIPTRMRAKLRGVSQPTGGHNFQHLLSVVHRASVHCACVAGDRGGVRPDLQRLPAAAEAGFVHNRRCFGRHVGCGNWRAGNAQSGPGQSIAGKNTQGPWGCASGTPRGPSSCGGVSPRRRHEGTVCA